MEALESILKQWLDMIVDDIRSKMPNASGKTAQEIQVVIIKSTNGVYAKVTGQIEAPMYIYTLEHGRGPTKNGHGSGPTLRESILAWIATRGFSFPLQSRNFAREIKDANALSWAISISIHKNGNLLYRNGGRSGVLSTTITQERIDAFIKVFGNTASKVYLNELVKKIM